MTVQRTIVGWLWKVPVCGVAHALGTVAGAAIATALGLALPRLPQGADPAVQSLLLLPAGMAIAVGMAAVAVGLPGRRWERALVLAAFMFVVNGIANGLEMSVFSTLGGAPAATAMAAPAAVLCAIAVSWLFPAPDAARPSDVARAYLRNWTAGALSRRLALAVVAFPVIYFAFGALISPIVVPYYERLEFLAIPPLPVLLSVLLTRSVLLLAASLPIIVLWGASRARLVVGLGLAHFAAVGLAGLIQGTFLPAILRWTHGMEILADSFGYALVLTWLLAPQSASPAYDGQATTGRASRQPARDRESSMKAARSGALVLAAKIAALTLLLVIVQGIGSLFLPAAEATQAPEASGSFLSILIGVLLLQTLALSYPVVRSRWHGWPLALAVFVLYFGTVTFQSQVESMVYLGAHMSPAMLRGIVLMGLFTAAVFSPMLVLVLGRWRPGRPVLDEADTRLRRPATILAWRLFAGSAVFVALYYLFGYYIAWQDPVLRGYYGGTDPGSFLAQMSGIVRDTPWLLPLQFARGLIWVLLALLVVRMMRGPWWEAGLALSVLFAVPAVYLLIPNPLMPEAVRMRHLVETAPYQFLFGWFVAWLLAREPHDVASLLHHHPTRA